MEALISSAFRAIGSIFVPGMFGVFIKSLLLTVLLLVMFTMLVSGLCLALIPHMHIAALAWLVPVAGFIGSHVLAWFLFPGMLPIIVNFFANRIVTLIEQYDYPAAAQPRVRPPFWPEFWHDVGFAIKAVALNILILPVYLISHMFSPILFYWLNGYLLGREFFFNVARRHQPLGEAEAFRLRYGRLVLIAGVMLAFLATVPVANLFAPFWGMAMMTHLYHHLTHMDNAARAPIPLS